MLRALRERGEIGNRVAMVNVADAFGIKLAESARPALEEAGFEIVYYTSYPLGTQDLSTVVKGAADADPDAFVAFSYPPDTFALTKQAQIEGLRPGAFHTAVATAFPSYQVRFGDAVEGTLGIGGVDADSQAFQDCAARLEEARLAAMPKIVSEMVKPAGKIRSINVSHVTGLGHAGAGGSMSNSPIAHTLDATMEMALTLPAMPKLAETIGMDMDTAREAPKDPRRAAE